MHVLQNCFILNHLDLPTIPWEVCNTTMTLNNHILWTVKNEPFRPEWGTIFGKIGITSKQVKEYVIKEYPQLEKRRLLICYPYYTAYKSGTIDLTYERSVIEGVEGKIENLKKKHRVDETMIFTQEDIEIFGNDTFLTQDETITLIDYCRDLRKRCMGELEFGKNILLYWSFVQETRTNMIPFDDKQLLFYQLKVLQ